VFRGVDGGASSTFIHSKEGVTQGDALSMVAYGIGILPLIRHLKRGFPGVKQPWYADNSGVGAHFPVLWRFFERLQVIGPSYGYYPEPDKSILIVRPENKANAKIEFADLGFKVMMGSQYLGGFIGKEHGQDVWLEGLTEKWTLAVTSRLTSNKCWNVRKDDLLSANTMRSKTS
jgi:hypothetical protein